MSTPNSSPQELALPPEGATESSMDETAPLSGPPETSLSQDAEQQPTIRTSESDIIEIAVPESTVPSDRERTIVLDDEDLTDNESVTETNNDDDAAQDLGNPDATIYFDANTTLESNNKPTGDIITRIPFMYRLIDLVYESGSTAQGGLVEKVIIDQESLGRLLNKIMPGSFQTISNINFKSLDSITIKPKGVYGSHSEIARFLLNLDIIDTEVAKLLSQPGNNGASTGLRSGLYFALRPGQETAENQPREAFLIYWPEESTWRDDAESSVQRNRVTFMRYLTQLTDQIIALVSKDEAKAFVWESSSPNLDTFVEDEDEDDDGRMFVFEVQKSEDKEENVTASPGFKVEIPRDMFANQKLELVGGETSVGVLASSLQHERVLSNKDEMFYNKLGLNSLLCDRRRGICLRKLDDTQLQLLLGTSLRERHADRITAYEKDCTTAQSECNRKLDANLRDTETQIGKERPQIEQEIREVWKTYSSRFREFIASRRSTSDESQSWDADKYPCIEVLRHEYPAGKMESIPSQPFQDLKTRITFIRTAFETQERTEEEQAELIRKVLKELPENLKDVNANKKGLTDRLKSFGWTVITLGTGDKDSDTRNEGSQSLAELDDISFLRELGRIVEAYPTLQEVRQSALDALREYLSKEEPSFIERQTRKAITSTKKLRMDRIKQVVDSEFNSKKRELWKSLWRDIRGAMDPEPRNSLLTRIDLIEQVRKWNHPPDITYRVRATHITYLPKQTRYAFYPLKLRKADMQRQDDDAFIPQPQVRWDEAALTFDLEEGISLEFIQPMRDRCLVVLASSDKVFIYMNELSQISRAINSRSFKYNCDRVRLGSRPIYAYDEATRTLALCHGEEELYLSWYIFDERFSILQAGRKIPLVGWHATSAMQSLCFVAGSTQVCLTDQSGFARILSLDSEQFGPAHLQLSPPFGHIFSTPDGSCLLVTTGASETGSAELLAYHWASFGTETRGFRPGRLLPKSTCKVISFGKHSKCHLVMLSETQPYSISSMVLYVKQKSAKFDLRAQELQSTTHNQKTINNCLIDSHVEVWLRFPVIPAVPRDTLSGSLRQRRSITFVSEGDFDKATAYFSKLIGTFERTAQKPTDGKLLAIAVGISSEMPFSAEYNTSISCFPFGGYLVELICLIPIQLAVTRDNNFIPLKDGVLNPAFERELLGADVPTIISSLSLGWYESLFQSYLATKPVRVVSSMGEQSVGKSYCLNHLADTSFAGSAMRTTEGVWLSCTPTNDYLLVALDFEGVQSIERSAQEDALLVLFNSAISNMVLFRNNFAISRNISSMFKSFQSSATVLDPDLNPGLFNSDLAIIIKDVIGSDKHDIVREFSEKFQAIVQEEKGQNFITRLHRGRLNIIPWPVIKSRNFYTLFSGVRVTLEKRLPTYGGGSVFLHTLKTLMAKIKANDWGALDQNLATHRARQLTQLLPSALSRGAMAAGSDSWNALKELDTDREIESFSDDIFWVPDGQELVEPGSNSAEQYLRDLIKKHYQHSPVTRYEVPEEEFLISLQALLNFQFDRRVEQIQEWVSTNLNRFPQENQDIRDLLKLLENTVLAARAAIRICSSKCSTCHLLCLRAHRHAGEHDCGTDHKCPHPCSVDEGHPTPTRCGLPSGHVGRHLCEPGKHTCGQQCSLWARGGCQIVCVGGIDHLGDHACSARLHTCGQPCDLWRVTQDLSRSIGGICMGVCEVPWDQEHERHACASSNACPFKCQLCPRLCSSSDHLHGLDPESVHLCGQEHACTKVCDMSGICQIETQPSAIIERFTGKFEQFQYTRYSQEKRRLSCAIPIAPGQLAHEGQHVHSVGTAVFHYCDVQCPHCEYYCTLPLGHPQQQHETNHGSMVKTQWLLDGPASSVSYELQDHKYGSGDQGSTVLCSLLCSQQGRHAHVDYCRSNGHTGTCGGEDHQHIDPRVGPNPSIPKDWISHRLYWARSGFKDPYSRNEQVEFAKCDSHCAGLEHKATSSTPASSSYCTMPIFHKPVSLATTLKKGYVSPDGHVFECENPFDDYQSHHIVFVIDNSTSMRRTDQGPLQNTPVTTALKSSCNNRYGAVISALYTFWKSREMPNDALSSQTSYSSRADAYSILMFSEAVTCHVSNDLSSSPEQLTRSLLPQKASYGTNFESAIEGASAIIEQNWDTARKPVVIFLSDGEGSVSDDSMLRLCQRCVQLGMPLAFYAISFSSYTYIPSLERMAKIAAQVYETAWSNRRAAKNNKKTPCEYVDVNGALELANRFLVISQSLQKPRAALIGSHNSRLELLANESFGEGGY